VIALTGGSGFLGWHTRVLARTLGRPVDCFGIDGAERLVHLAGVNRGDVAANVALARDLAERLDKCATPPATIVYANSIQAGNGTPYGDAKAEAATILAEAARSGGSSFVDVKLPNLFGEHGRPHYNSVVATFAHLLATGGTPRMDQDRTLPLLHAGDAAAQLLGLSTTSPEERSVRELLDRLTTFATVYEQGEIPALESRFDVRLFNTYRSFCEPGHPVALTRRADARGELVEAVKAHGSPGTTFVSSTHPGVTRGEHFHRAKVERFLVLRGEAVIRLRRVLFDDVVTYKVSGAEPTVVDMPTLWAHDITNVGDGELLTLFWSDGVFDPATPDTFRELVQ
jgi:UDP-2-acetamido-2,6-beta-L-arabino-hexul-4-ose reductase